MNATFLRRLGFVPPAMRQWLLGSLWLAASLSVASAQDLVRPTAPACACAAPANSELTLAQATAPPANPGPSPAPAAPSAQAAAPPPDTGTANFQPLASSALGDTSFAAAPPQIMGDFGGYLTRRVFYVPTTSTTTTTTTTLIGGKIVPITMTSTSTVLVPVTAAVPVVGRAGSGFKIADDASPIPTDRVFFSWNGFNSLSGQAGSNPGSTTTSTIAPPVVGVGTSVDPTTITTRVAPVTLSAASIDLNREIFGFEKTFLDGNASIEVRVPIFQSSGSAASGVGSGGFVGDNLGDVTAIAKYALVKDPNGVLSVGLATTFPTGPTVPGPDGNFQAVLFQPFVGFYRPYGDFFVEGFSSVILSTENHDPTLLFNDVSFGYRVYRNPGATFLTGISSVLEVHVTTPLDNRDSESTGIVVPDIVSLTAGVHIDLGPRSELSIGCNVPVTGPRPYSTETLVQLNYRF